LGQLAVNIDCLEVSYCEGWDPQARATAGPVSAAMAAERDRVGEQYAVLLAAAGQPLAMIEVARRDLYCAVWFFDQQRRRAFLVDCRQLTDGRLFVAGGRQWAYTTGDQDEFGEDTTWGEYWPSLDGGHSAAVYRGSATSDTGIDQMVRPPDHWLDAPQFGEWGRFIRAFPIHLAALGHELSPVLTLEDNTDPTARGLPAGMRPWRPPRPLQPGRLDLLFTPGTRLQVASEEAIPGVGGTVTVEVSQIGTLRMPSGALIACDPGYLGPPPGAVETYAYQQSHQPFTATAPPGEYPVLLSEFRWLAGSGPNIAAAKVWVRDGPVASWEMALRPGEDPRTLPGNGWFGFGVDGGAGCFYDAAAAHALAPLAQGFVLGYQTTAEITDEESGANLIAFSSGWGDGSYPVWIGRTAAGDIACFIADMLTFDTMNPVSR
jgi:Protein of unknown function (DUF4241)